MSPLDVVLFFLFELTFSERLVQVPLTFKYPLYLQDFMQVNVPTIYQCIELCIAMKLCRNLHFKNNKRVCVLNSDDYDRKFTWNMAYRFIPISKKDIPQEIGGACKDHSCAIDEICVENDLTYLCVGHEFPTVKCPLDWGRRGDLCFSNFMGNKMWTEARDYCAGIGGELITMDARDEYWLNMNWIYFKLSQRHKQSNIEKIWTALRYPDLPSWIPISNLPTDGGSHPCLDFNVTNQDVRRATWEYVSCDEKNTFACQRRNPDHWT